MERANWSSVRPCPPGYFSRIHLILPNHPHDENTVIYLLYFRPQMPPSYELLWTCSHFEHASNSDMKNLCKVLDRLATLSEINSSNLELLDAFGERLIISVPEPRRTLWEHVKNCGAKIVTS